MNSIFNQWSTRKPPPDGSISETQQLQFELMRRRSFNEFDGPKVVADLLAHRALWRAAMMHRPYTPFLPLRDMEDGVWNVDTLMILSSGEDDDALMELARTWKADEVGWLSPEDRSELLFSGNARYGPNVLSIWWD